MMKGLLEQVDADNADAYLDILAAAGAREVIDFASGRAVFSTVPEIRQYRVYCLIKALVDQQLVVLSGSPAGGKVRGLALHKLEDLVQVLFKITSRRATSLVQSTFARYPADLAKLLDKLLAQQLADAEWQPNDKRWRAVVPIGISRDRLDELFRAFPKARPVVKDGAIVEFPAEAWQHLIERGFTLPAVPEKPRKARRQGRSA